MGNRKKIKKTLTAGNLSVKMTYNIKRKKFCENYVNLFNFEVRKEGS
jgi:hypothetical protein